MGKYTKVPTPKETVETNRLIAEYRGAEFKNCGEGIHIAIVDEDFCPKDTTHIDTFCLMYHNSWDWLIPVIDDITSSDEYIIYKQENSSMFSDGSIEINTKFIQSTYTQVVDYVNWFKSYKEILTKNGIY